MPCTADDIATTTKTPTATPMMVSEARTLLARIDSKAMPTPSKAVNSRVPMLTASLLPQGGDRVQSGGAARGIDARQDPHAAADQGGGDDGPGGHARRQRGGRGDALREGDAERDADERADGAQRGRLDEELRHDVAPARAERLADADLPRPLGHRDEHDVHDDDRPDEQPEGGEHDAG